MLSDGKNSAGRWRLLALPLALAIDLFLGDPPNRLHPVAWMGSGIGFLQRRAPAEGRVSQLLYGGLIAAGGATVVAVSAGVLQRLYRRLPPPAALAVEAVLLKMTLSLDGLTRAGRAVETPLQAGDMDEARRQLAWHLVSRETRALDEAQIAAATVESLAENASDSLVAPLFFYAIGGLPAAAAYRFLNTADAMLGYRDPAREWLGKAPARLDDLANLIPARATALALVLCAPVVGGCRQTARRIWRRDAGATASPNAGHPMAAAAGALEVELEKPGHYRLGEGLRRPRPQEIGRAIRLVQATALLALFGAMVLQLVRHAAGPSSQRAGSRRRAPN